MLCLCAIVALSIYFASTNIRRSQPFRSIAALILEESIQAYRTGGPDALGAKLNRLKFTVQDRQFLVDRNGVDLATGRDRSDLLVLARGSNRFLGAESYSVFSDPTGSFRLIVRTGPPAFDFTSILPYYIPILVGLAALCWLLASDLASPLRQLARTVDRFGAGDLDSRSALRRGDEIGELARAYNQMADRIQTLVTAERQLLQDISHELRSPLARLCFAAELTRTAPDRNAAASRLDKEIGRLTDLVGGLIQVTRAEGEFTERNLTEVSLDSLVNQVADSCQLEAEAQHCRIQVDATTPTALRADPELLRRAIENVLRNAIRYSPEHTTIDVTLENRVARGAVVIRDRGPGVPDEMLPKIFTPFYRVDPSRDSSTGGLGLGLAIAQRAVMLHHGQITAQNLDPGLEVTIALPLSRP